MTTTQTKKQVDHADYTLVLANQDQIQQHLAGTFVPWGRGNTFEAHTAANARERAEGEWAINGGMKTWVLVKRDDLEGEIYSGCNTYRRRAMVKRKESDIVEPTWMYGIASVITPVKHHRNGFATHMLRLLHYQIASPTILPPFPTQWGAPPPALTPEQRERIPNAIGSILWSDVGSTFYSKCTIGLDNPGWVVTDEECLELVWKTQPPSDIQPNKWELYTMKDLNDISHELSLVAQTRLAGLDSKSESYFQQDPSSTGALAFQPTRGSYLGKKKAPADEPIGARLRSSDGSPDAIVIFTAYNESVGPRVLIECIENLLPQDVPSLLELLDGVAHNAGRDEGWVWGLNEGSDLVKAFRELPDRQVVTKKRDEVNGHLLGVAWYGNQEERGRLLDRQMWNWC